LIKEKNYLTTTMRATRARDSEKNFKESTQKGKKYYSILLPAVTSFENV